MTMKPLAAKKKDIKSNKLRVLILEDNPVDAELMERQLKKDGIAFTAQRVDTRSGFLKALKTFEPDVILASRGGSMGRFHPWSLFRRQRIRVDTQAPGLPPGSAMGGWVRPGCLVA